MNVLRRLLVVLWAVMASCEAGKSEESLVNQFDQVFFADRSAEAFAKSFAIAEQIEAVGEQKGDEAYKVRGLIRKYLTQIHFGRYQDGWQEWRREAESLSEALPSPSVEYCEFLMVDGYLKARFLGDIKMGIGRINEAVSLANSLSDDDLLAKSSYFLGRTLVFDGNGILADENLYRAVYFAESSENLPVQFRSLVELYERGRIGRALDLKRLRVKINVVAKELGLVFVLGTRAEQAADAAEQVDSVFPNFERLLRESPGDLRQTFSNALFAAKYFSEQGEWESMAKYIELADRIANALQDEYSQKTLLIGKAILAATEGRKGDAFAMMEEFAAFLRFARSSASISREYRLLAKIFDDQGDHESSLACYRMAEENLPNAVHDYFLEIEDAARAYGEDLHKTREHRVQMERKDLELARTTWQYQVVCLGLVVILGGCWVWQASRRSYGLRKELQRKVDEQTESLRIAKESAEQARQDADQANQAKTDFLAQISHELRNPLSAIVSSCELLDVDLAEQDHDTKRTIQACTDNLLGVIEDVWDYSRIEAGRIRLQEREFSPQELMVTVERIVAPHTKKSVFVSTVVESTVPDFVSADAAKLRQVLVNLGQNASRHASSGCIVLHCSAPKPDGSVLRFTVEDQGEGIEKARLNEMFKPYRSFSGGHGLGLFISSSFVQAMGGEIECESTPEVGTTISFEIPVQPATRPSTPVATVEPMSLRRVLIMDDDPTNRDVLSRLLSAIGFTAFSVSNWDEAADLLHQGVDAVLLDLRMRPLNGFEILSNIRNLRLGRMPAVVAMTGDSSHETMLQTQKFGFHGFLSKPFKSDRLLAELDQAYRNKSGIHEEDSSPQPMA